MKSWLCYSCGRRGETEDNIVMKICNACQEEMWEENPKSLEKKIGFDSLTTGMAGPPQDKNKEGKDEN
jgi:hypothetical protein